VSGRAVCRQHGRTPGISQNRSFGVGGNPLKNKKWRRSFFIFEGIAFAGQQKNQLYHFG
jgi:hypothetical protein